MNPIKKLLSKIRKPDFKVQRQEERKRMFFPVFSETKKFEKRKKTTLHIPSFLYNGIHLKYLKYYISGLLGIIILGIGSLFVGPFFTVQNIEIYRQDSISNIDIAYRSLEYIRNKPIFLVHTRDIAETLKNYQKNIKEVKISKKLPHTISITIGSYKEVFNIALETKEYHITENGVLIPGKKSDSLQNISLGNPLKTENFLDYKQIFDASMIQKIVLLKEKIETNFLKVKIESIDYYEKEREVHILLSSGIRLLFDIEGDVEDQIKKLAIYNKEAFDISQKTLVYIDLRIQNKLFICSREKEFQCMQNLKNIYLFSSKK